MQNVLRVILVLLGTILYGCAAQTIRHDLGSPIFRSENLPVRIVRVIVIGKDPEIVQAQIRDIEEASALLEPQMGIVFKVVDTRLLPKGESFEEDVADAATHLETFLRREHLKEGVDFDMAVGAKESNIGLLSLQWLGVPLYRWQGVNDPRDGCWCHIVIKRRDVHTVAHEFMHAFIQDQFDPAKHVTHDTNGLMASAEFSILPGVTTTAIDAANNSQNFLTPRARMLALRWKWMRFGMPSKIALWRIKEAEAREQRTE